MNGFADKGLDESHFGSEDKSGLNIVKAFDAFPKTKPSYTQKTQTGGVWTVVFMCASLWLTCSELGRWWMGTTTHSFSVEQGVGKDLQINLDLVVAMKCEDLHINVQDASGDRILAGMALTVEYSAQCIRIRSRETFISPREGMDTWSLGNIWIITVSAPMHA